MLLTKEIEVGLGSKSIAYYESLGYKIPRKPAKWNKDILTVPSGTRLSIKITDLPLNSNLKINYQCDYCGKKGDKTYSSYNKSREIIQKDACRKCVPKKIEESNLINYGVKHTTQLDSTKGKMRATNIEKYGVEYASQNEEVKKKMETVFIEKYGYNTPAKNESVKNKIIKTNIERYGGTSPTLNEVVRNKQISTMQKTYGVSFPQQNEEIKLKSMASLYNNNTAPCSRQQRHIHNIIGGNLNFPHHTSFLDIAFPEEKIYLEVDLGGHELQLKFGNVTKEEYENKERNRWYALYRKGWKEIRIISSKDKIPTDEKIFEMISYAKEYLATGRHYIKFYLDEDKVKTSQFEKEYDFGELRYIYKKDKVTK